LQVEEYFRKRIEKRSARLEDFEHNSRKLQVFVSHENLRTFCGKDNPIDLTGAILQWYRKFSILATRCGVNSNFLNLCKATVGIYGKFYRAVVGFSFFKVWLEFREKGKLTARQRSLDFR
jgi:hypothetical protein